MNDRIKEQIEILDNWANQNDKKETGEVGNFDRELADTLEKLLAVYEAAKLVLDEADDAAEIPYEGVSPSYVQETLQAAIAAVKDHE